MNASTPHSPSTPGTAARRPSALRACAATLLMAAAPLAANAQAEAAAETAEAKIPASRFVTPETMPAYLQQVMSTLSMNDRLYDPFGQIQDPNAKPKPVARPKPGRPTRPTAAKATPFGDIINKIRVTTVIPSENRFLVGSSIYRKGKPFKLKFRGRLIDVQILDVTASKIEFQNTDSGEIAVLDLGLMPKGMSSGADGLTAPGLVPENQNTPLELDGNSGF